MLDVGCGVGALLISLALEGKIVAGVGCDVNSGAIEVARKAALRIPRVNIQFVVATSVESIPRGPFDVVTMIDVMHHVSPSLQKRFFIGCADRLRSGGLLIYKDMAERPLWKNLFNRLHDFVIARQHIHYVPLETIKDWAKAYGLTLTKELAYSRFAYAHELLVLKKGGTK